MPEAVTTTGAIQAASLAQTIEYLGSTFTVTKQVATGYDVTTTEATPENTQQTVKGIYDFRYLSPIDSGSDVRVRERAIVIAGQKLNGEALDFLPGVGDTVTSENFIDSIRDVNIMQGAQGVSVFYRLTLAGS